MAKRVALVAGDIGGLGEVIGAKMADAGYTVAVTFSPSNKASAEWLKAMKENGYDVSRVSLRCRRCEAVRLCLIGRHGPSR